jgi:hypothetical protein
VGVTDRRRRLLAFRRVAGNQHCRFRAENDLSLAEKRDRRQQEAGALWASATISKDIQAYL